MINPVVSIRRYFHNPAVPREYQRNFFHLYWEIAWFGILTGSAANFLNVYAARLGASSYQIGLLVAMPAMVNLFLSMPTGSWLQTRPVSKMVFWTAALSRLGYFLWIPLPWLFGNQTQIWALIIITLAMGVPMCGFSVSFNALLAATVPTEWRAYVVGVRNMLQAFTFVIASLGSGLILSRIHFPFGYPVIFGIGFLSAAMSTFHLSFVRPQVALDGAAGQDMTIVLISEEKTRRYDWRAALRLDIWWTPFRKILLVLLGFHLVQFLSSPIFSLYTVRNLHLTDANIGLGMALYWLTVMLGSTQLSRFVRIFGHQRLTGWGICGTGVYVIGVVLSKSPLHFYLLSIVGGFSWALVGGAIINYLLEHVPDNDRSSHLAWYNTILNAGTLFGSLAGSLFAGYIGIGLALIVFGVLRLLAGIAVLKWG